MVADTVFDSQPAHTGRNLLQAKKGLYFSFFLPMLLDLPDFIIIACPGNWINLYLKY